MAVQLDIISQINAVSGDERNLREYIKKNITADEVMTDTMGNLIAFVKGRSSEKKVAVVSHMDENGFIVSDFTDKGYIKFQNAGKILPETVVSKRVIIGGKVKGVIGMKAIHLQKPDERKTIVKIKDLFIDIGAKDKDEAAKLVEKGDYITFDTHFEETGDIIKGKALDRIGVYAAVKAMECTLEYDTYFVFSVQKEIGSRGAAVTAHRLMADFVILVDTVDSADVYGVKKEDVIARLGAGAVISYMDKKMIGDVKFTDRIREIAEREKIPVQIQNTQSGFGDSMMQHNALASVCAAVKIPIRYARTPVELASKTDISNTVRLLVNTLNGDFANGIIE